MGSNAWVATETCIKNMRLDHTHYSDNYNGLDCAPYADSYKGLDCAHYADS